MKLVAKCSASASLSDPVHVKVCNPISLIKKCENLYFCTLIILNFS